MLTIHCQEQLRGLGVLHRIGDDLLAGTQQSFSLLLIDGDLLGDLHTDIQALYGRSDPLQGSAQVPGSGVAQLPHRGAHISQQLPGHCRGLVDVLARLLALTMLGSLQLQVQHSELMADQVMELPGDAHPFTGLGSVFKQH